MKDSSNHNALSETAFFILLALYTPRHGYAIMQFVEARTAGRLKLGAGSLYGALQTMTSRGWIVPCSAEVESRRKEYEITQVGRLIAEIELMRLKNLAIIAEEIVTKN